MMRTLMAIMLVGLLALNLACGPTGGGEDTGAGDAGATDTTETTE